MSAVDFGHRTVVVRGSGLALRWRVRTVVMCLILAALTLAVTAWALALGDYPLTMAQVWAALTNDPDAGFARTVVVEWRAPRAVAAAVFGAALPAVAEPGRGGCHRNLGLRGRADCHGARGTGEQGNRGTGEQGTRGQSA